MAEFIIRIEFRKSKSKSYYEKIRVELKNEGFRSSTLINESLVQLPIGEFYINTNMSTKEIIKTVKNALVDIQNEYSILVSEVVNIDSDNLIDGYIVNYRTQ